MKELLFRERFGTARAILDASGTAPTSRQWLVLDHIIDSMEEPLSTKLRGFQRYCQQMRSFGYRTAADWDLVKDAYQYMDNFGRWDEILAMNPKRKPTRKR